MSNETLSDKRIGIKINDEEWYSSGRIKKEELWNNFYPEDDVREAIKKLQRWKEIMKTWHLSLEPNTGLLCSEFDRLLFNVFGSFLCDSQGDNTSIDNQQEINSLSLKSNLIDSIPVDTLRGCGKSFFIMNDYGKIKCVCKENNLCDDCEVEE